MQVHCIMYTYAESCHIDLGIKPVTIQVTNSEPQAKILAPLLFILNFFLHAVNVHFVGKKRNRFWEFPSFRLFDFSSSVCSVPVLIDVSLLCSLYLYLNH